MVRFITPISTNKQSSAGKLIDYIYKPVSNSFLLDWFNYCVQEYPNYHQLRSLPVEQSCRHLILFNIKGKLGKSILVVLPASIVWYNAMHIISAGALYSPLC